MKVNEVFVNITSDDPARLIAFYRDVVGLTPKPGLSEFAFDLGTMTLGFDGHSDTRGKAGEPSRWLLNFSVDDLQAEEQRLTAQGVEFIRSRGRETWGGLISTFLDPDGNYLQLIEYRPQPAPAK
ncbi:MAG: VOC family protein [Dehalococcoidia bacterium]